MVSDGAAEQYPVSRLQLRLPKLPGGADDTHSSCVDKESIGFAALDDLGVAGDDGNTCLTCRLRHRGDDAAQVADGETFLQDEACREIERFGTCHGQVVDGAVDCQFSNIPSREEEGAYYVGVGCESQALACSVYAKGCRVIHGIEQGIREGGREDAFNEVVGGFAATAMAERDFLVAQIEFVTTCLPCALDLFEDVVDACIIHRYSWLSLQRRNTENRRNGRRDAIHCALWEGSTPLAGAIHCAPTSTCFSHMFLLN